MKDPEVSCACKEDAAFVSLYYQVLSGLYVLSGASKVFTLSVKYPAESAPQKPLMIRST